MTAYHLAWLSAHPHRTQEWLKEKLAEGFDIHHLDGDHENNDPLNLVLIDAADHMMLHNGKSRMVRGDKAAFEKVRARKLETIGKEAYLHRQNGETWREVGNLIGTSGTCAQMWAEKYAESIGSLVSSAKKKPAKPKLRRVRPPRRKF